MKLRDLLLVLVALALLSTVVAVAILTRLTVWNTQPPATSPSQTAQATPRKPLSLADQATATPLPRLVTPTPSPSSTVTPFQ